MMPASNSRPLFNLVTLLLHAALLLSFLSSLPVRAQITTPSLSDPLTRSSQTTRSTTTTPTSTSSTVSSQSTTTATSIAVTTTSVSSQTRHNFPPTFTSRRSSTTEQSTSTISTSPTEETTSSEAETTKSTSSQQATTHRLAASPSSKVTSTSSTAVIQSQLPTPSSATIQNPESGTSATNSSDASSKAASPKGFLKNTAAVASTFSILGLISLGAVVFGLFYCVRRRRRHFEDLEDTDYFGGKRGQETFRSSFAVGDPEKGPAENPFEEEVETALGHAPQEHNPFSDPYSSHYALPGASIIPDEYRLSMLEQAQRNAQPRVSNYAGQMSHQNYGSANNTIPLGTGPAHYGYPTITLSSAPVSSQQGYSATDGQYEQAPVHYLQEPHVLYQSQPSQLHLQRQPSTNGRRAEFGLAC